MDSTFNNSSFQQGFSRNANLVRQLKEWQSRPRSLVFVSLAESYRKEGLAQEALEVLAEGLEFHPSLGSALLVKARCLFDLKRYGEALKLLKELLRSNPANVKARSLEAEVYIRLGQRKSALRVLRQLCAEFPLEKEWQESLKSIQGLEMGELLPHELPLVKSPNESALDASPVGEIGDFRVETAAELSPLWAVDGPWNQSLIGLGSLPMAKSIETPIPSNAPISLDPQTVSQGAQLATQWSETDERFALEEETGGEEPTIATRTIAELYLRQGFRARALAVVQKILANDPSHKWARETLQALHSDEILPKPKVSPKERLAAKAQLLERLLLQIRLQKSARA